jgi:hypothetical protein
MPMEIAPSSKMHGRSWPRNKHGLSAPEAKQRPPGAPPSVFEGGDFSSQFPIDNQVTTLVHYPRKVVRLAFRETPLTTQI